MADLPSHSAQHHHQPQPQTQHAPARPALEKRHTAPRLPRAPLPQTKSKTKLHKAKLSKDTTRKSAQEQQDEVEAVVPDSEDDMTSFLQYCAVCEKQLPSISTLYCSDTCRRRDLNLSPTYALFTKDIPIPTADSRTLSSPHTPTTDIVPQMAPTRPSESIIPRTHSTTSISSSNDDQPPNPRGRPRRDRPTTSRTTSEAARYLSQFHSSSSMNDRSPSRSRTRTSRPSTAGTDSSHSTNMPALSFTPTSPTDSSASTSHTSASASSRLHNPNPRRTNRWSASFESHGDDLVTPIGHYPPTAPSSLSTITEKTIADKSIREGLPTFVVGDTGEVGEAGAKVLGYERRREIPGSEMGSTRGRGSLGKLFGGRGDGVFAAEA